MNGKNPSERGAENLDADQKEAPSVRANKKILFVDDDKDWREIVASSLADAGYEVLTASDATEAMTRMEELEPDLIILDLDLAGESGFTLMGFLKRNQPDVPVILFTGLSHDEEQIQAMLKRGAHQYVRKGPLEDLLRAVKAALFSAAP